MHWDWCQNDLNVRSKLGEMDKLSETASEDVLENSYFLHVYFSFTPV